MKDATAEAKTIKRNASSLMIAFLVIALMAGCRMQGSLSKPAAASVSEETAALPNILIIVADDLGYSDLGAFGGEISTPNLDALAMDGLLLTNFFVGGTCSPTRSMLLSGVDHHIAGLGTMTEHIQENQIGQPGYEGYLNDRVISIADRLKSANYRTYMTGKWHLGMTKETSPNARGFDKSFVLLNGGAGHFDQTGLHAKVHPAPYRRDTEMVDLPEDFTYSSDFYTETLIDYMESGRETGDPFFAYLSYTAPHWPLQAPPEDIAKYAGRYDKGWHALQAERFARMKSLGLVPESARLPKIVTDWPAWENLDPETRAYEARRMEVFAAMVDRMDQQVGVLIDYLKRSNQFDNTVIIFLSDNGPEGAALQDIEPFLSYIPNFDSSLEALGTAASYTFLEERWAQAINTPYSLFKGMASDGGSHVPAFITYSGFSNQGGRYDGNLSVMDIAPTLLDLTDIEEGEGVTHPIQGKSILPLLTNQVDTVRGASEGIGYELFNKRYYRKGKWKVVHQHKPWGPNDWQLFDMLADPGETNDLSNEYPEIRARLISAWEDHALENGIVLGEGMPDR